MEGALQETNINVSQRITFGQRDPERCTLLADWYGLFKLQNSSHHIHLARSLFP